jgi:germination protein M
VVNTLTQFPEVRRVKILVEGEELIGPSGQPRGFMEPLPNPGEGTVSRDITLYFGNRDATAVVAETRTVSIPADIQLPDLLRIAVEQLIKGPRNQDLSPTIPPGTRVLSVSVEEDVAHVDFSQEMHTQHWGGAAGESMTVQSIVNTLTEFPDIRRVLMTVEGQPLAIDHMVLDQPVGRSEDLAAK